VNAEPRSNLREVADIERLVVAFYRDAAVDELLGPVFHAAAVDWPSHIATLVAFWSRQLLDEPGYDGNPLLAHRDAHRATPFTDAHFERWLELFADTVDAEFEGPGAELAKHKAAKMASAMRRLLNGPAVLTLQPR
jgi:hemoglobin